MLGRKSDLQGGHGGRDRGAKNGKREGRGIARPRRKRQAGKAEGMPVRQRERAEVVAEGRRAGPAQGRDDRPRGILPLGRQKHRVSIWQKVSTERSKIPLSVIRNVLNQ